MSEVRNGSFSRFGSGRRAACGLVTKQPTLLPLQLMPNLAL